MREKLSRLKKSTTSALKLVLMLCISIWLAALANHLTLYDFNQYGIYPRVTDGLIGVLLWPFLHGGFTHLAMNTSPLIVLGFLVALRGPFVFVSASAVVVVLGGCGVWIFGREAYHIGASGLVFGYFGFLVALALYERQLSTFVITGIVLFYYGGIIFGVLPREEFVSWEGHLFGLLAGIIAAGLFARQSVRR